MAAYRPQCLHGESAIMSPRLGIALRAAGMAGFAIAFLWGMGVCVKLVAAQAGFVGAVLAVLAAPLTFLLVPWYALITLGEWTPFLLNYCAGSVALALLAGGKAILRGTAPR